MGKQLAPSVMFKKRYKQFYKPLDFISVGFKLGWAQEKWPRLPTKAPKWPLTDKEDKGEETVKRLIHKQPPCSMVSHCAGLRLENDVLVRIDNDIAGIHRYKPFVITETIG